MEYDIEKIVIAPTAQIDITNQFFKKAILKTLF